MEEGSKDIPKIVTTIAGTVTVLGISTYCIWQIIMGIPILEFIIAVSTTIALILAYCIAIWWAFIRTRHTQKMSDLLIREKERQLGQIGTSNSNPNQIGP